MRHLTEREIQEFVDTASSAQDEDIRRHLAECNVCRAQVAAYRRLSVHLADDSGFELAPNFAASVMERIAPAEAERSAWSLVAAIAASLVVVLGAALVFVDLDLILAPLVTVRTWLESIGASTFTSIESMLSAVNVSPVLLALAILVVLSLAAVERLALATRREHTMITV